MLLGGAGRTCQGLYFEDYHPVVALPPQQRPRGRNLTFALAVFVVSAGLGLAWAWQGQTVYIARAELEVGTRFPSGPLEPGPVAALRLQGILRAQHGVVQARVSTSTSHSGTHDVVQAELTAASASTAESAMQQGLDAVLADYEAWHAEEIASHKEAVGRLLELQSRLQESLETGHKTVYAKAALQENLQRLDALRSQVQVLEATPPAIVRPIQLHTDTRDLDVNRGAAGLLVALCLGALAWRLRSQSAAIQGGGILLCGALVVAGLHQAESAPPGFVAQSYLRLARVKDVPVPANPSARRKLLGWVASEVRVGHLPSGVRLELRRVSDPSLGLYELRGVGNTPAALAQILEAATWHMAHWNDQGLAEEHQDLRDRRYGQSLYSARLLSQDCLQTHRRFAEIVLQSAQTRRAQSSIRTGVTQLMAAPAVHRVARGPRYMPYAAVGMGSGLLVLWLLAGLRREVDS